MKLERFMCLIITVFSEIINTRITDFISTTQKVVVKTVHTIFCASETGRILVRDKRNHKLFV